MPRQYFATVTLVVGSLVTWMYRRDDAGCVCGWEHSHGHFWARQIVARGPLCDSGALRTLQPGSGYGH